MLVVVVAIAAVCVEVAAAADVVVVVVGGGTFVAICFVIGAVCGANGVGVVVLVWNGVPFGGGDDDVVVACGIGGWVLRTRIDSRVCDVRLLLWPTFVVVASFLVTLICFTTDTGSCFGIPSTFVSVVLLLILS